MIDFDTVKKEISDEIFNSFYELVDLIPDDYDKERLKNVLYNLDETVVTIIDRAINLKND